MSDKLIDVEVVYATPARQVLITVKLPESATAAMAISASGILAQFPELDGQALNIGIFGQICPANQPVKPGDRVEIYRPLHCDPKDARRQRAARR